VPAALLILGALLGLLALVPAILIPGLPGVIGAVFFLAGVVLFCTGAILLRLP
jgi:hypothetical protein